MEKGRFRLILNNKLVVDTDDICILFSYALDCVKQIKKITNGRNVVTLVDVESHWVHSLVI